MLAAVNGSCRTAFPNARTCWIDDRPYDESAVFRKLAGPCRMTQFIAYALKGALCAIEHFPALLPPSTSGTRTSAAAFLHRAVDACSGLPVTADLQMQSL